MMTNEALKVPDTFNTGTETFPTEAAMETSMILLRAEHLEPHPQSTMGSKQHSPSISTSLQSGLTCHSRAVTKL